MNKSSLKILIIAPFGEGFLADSYTRGFETLGHQVHKFNSDHAYFNLSKLSKNPYSRRLFRKLLWEKLNSITLNQINLINPDLVLVFKGAFLNPDTIIKIRKSLQIPIVNYYPDNPYCGVPLNPYKTSAQRKDLIECLKEYSFVFTWNQHLVNRLKSDNVNSFYIPFGVDPYFYNPDINSLNDTLNKEYSVVLTGLMNKKRQEHLSAISGFNVDVWGVGWERASGDVSRKHNIHPERAFGRDCSALYKNAGVSLNVVDDLNMPGHNMRTFEIPASRGLMLSIYTDEQNHFFPEGEAAFYYRESCDLDDKIKYLLDNAEIRKRIKANAYKISLDHTYEKRVIDMLNIIYAS